MLWHNILETNPKNGIIQQISANYEMFTNKNAP
jgi:hypothetical protein